MFTDVSSQQNRIRRPRMLHFGYLSHENKGMWPIWLQGHSQSSHEVSNQQVNIRRSRTLPFRYLLKSWNQGDVTNISQEHSHTSRRNQHNIRRPQLLRLLHLTSEIKEGQNLWSSPTLSYWSEELVQGNSTDYTKDLNYKC